MSAKTETDSFTLEFDLPHAPEKVWRGLTEPALLSQWLMNTDMIPSVGRQFQFTMEPTQWWDGIVNCEVLESDAPHRISYTWQSGPASSPLDTIVTWTLTPTPNGTKLVLEHSGFNPSNKFAFSGAKDGWLQKAGSALPGVLAGI
jgi:uncharacterized protein YndB with AHSA1/START domain